MCQATDPRTVAKTLLQILVHLRSLFNLEPNSPVVFKGSGQGFYAAQALRNDEIILRLLQKAAASTSKARALALLKEVQAAQLQLLPEELVDHCWRGADMPSGVQAAQEILCTFRSHLGSVAPAERKKPLALVKAA